MVEPPSLSYRDNAPQPRSGPLGLLTLLTVGLVVAFLYFARDVIVPIALGILLSFLCSRPHVGSAGGIWGG